MEANRGKDVQDALIGWAVEALGRWAGVAPDQCPAQTPAAGAWLSNYGVLMSKEWKLHAGKGDRLLSIFSLVQAPGGEAVQQVQVPARPLSLETILPDEKDKGLPPQELWARFVGEFGRLPKGDGRFETFIHLFCKHAWAVPCTYGEAGVSLYEEFKALAALVYASGGAQEPATEFLLVGGDIPGIQGFLYTLTSKGAAKGLRGRSFFLQLLGDAVVRRLVGDLGLCSANVVYAAGGNFLMLVPPESRGLLSEWQVQFNHDLLNVFEGDLYLALAWEPLPRSAVATHEFADVRERLGARVATAKSRRFAEVVEEHGWELLFLPRGQGGLKEYCQVCQREPRPGEKLVTETTETGEVVSKCVQCHSFEELAHDIAYDRLWMVVAEADDEIRKEEGWRGLLAGLAGFAYRFEQEPPQVEGLEVAYALNDTGLRQGSAYGFRFVANVTPRIEQADRKWMQEHHPDLEVPSGERIKDFALMALQSQGIPRVGVLRMDVDNLGAVFSQYLRGSMAQVSALSTGLDLFFAGHLNRVCRKMVKEGEHENTLYVIYAGGDDLFVVGAWDRMPLLAERIREDFATYAGDNLYLTLSGGVTLEGRKFPLYRAAERAGEAEGQAKGYTRPDGHDKDAFCFLGQVVGWEEWPTVRRWQEELVALDQAGMPRTLIQVLKVVHGLYEATRRRMTRETGVRPGKSYYGRWIWMQAYALARLARRAAWHSKPADAEKRVKALQEGILTPETVHLSGLAARWAEYLLRAGEV